MPKTKTSDRVRPDRVRLYVTAPEGRYLPGLGSREQGEFFEVDPDQAERLREVTGLSPTNPPAIEEGVAAVEETVEEESDHAD